MVRQIRNVMIFMLLAALMGIEVPTRSYAEVSDMLTVSFNDLTQYTSHADVPTYYIVAEPGQTVVLTDVPWDSMATFTDKEIGIPYDFLRTGFDTGSVTFPTQGSGNGVTCAYETVQSYTGEDSDSTPTMFVYILRPVDIRTYNINEPFIFVGDLPATGHSSGLYVPENQSGLSTDVPAGYNAMATEPGFKYYTWHEDLVDKQNEEGGTSVYTQYTDLREHVSVDPNDSSTDTPGTDEPDGHDSSWDDPGSDPDDPSDNTSHPYDTYVVTIPTKIAYENMPVGEVDTSDDYTVNVRGDYTGVVHLSASTNNTLSCGKLADITATVKQGKIDWDTAAGNGKLNLDDSLSGTDSIDTLTLSGQAKASGCYAGVVTYTATRESK